MSGGPDARRGEGASSEARRNNPLNRLVPYLDLFARLDDKELARLAGVDTSMVATLRRQVNDITEGLAPYVDLLPRLSDDELVRLSGANIKTIRFWRLCQPRSSPRARDAPAARPREPVADWSSESPTTDTRTTIPELAFGAEPPPSMTSTQVGARPPERVPPAIDPAESQQSAAHLMNFDGEPFPGYEERRPTLPSAADDDADFTVELDR